MGSGESQGCHYTSECAQDRIAKDYPVQNISVAEAEKHG